MVGSTRGVASRVYERFALPLEMLDRTYTAVIGIVEHTKTC